MDPSRISEQRDKSWNSIKDLALKYGYERKHYDLDNLVKKISITQPKNECGSVVIEKTTHYLKRPFRPDAPWSKEDIDKLPLPINKVSKWVGLAPISIGARKQKFRPPLGYWGGYLTSDECKRSLCDNEELGGYPRYTLIEGSWDTNQSVLKEMCSNTSAGPPVEDLLEKSLSRYQKFGFPSINRIINRKWISGITLNPDAHPGVMSTCFGGKDKRSAYGFALEKAFEIYDAIVSRGAALQDFGLWLVGGRARKQDLTKDGKPPESRLILMPELPQTIISSLIGQPITTEMKILQVEKPEIENFMGQPVNLGGWRRIKEWAEPGTPVLELDWSRFDSTVLENVLVSAFCLLRTCFPRSKTVDHIFLFVMSGFIYKHVAIRQRFIYRICKGVPSGSPLTSIIGTISNWVCLNYVLQEKQLFGIQGPNDYGLAVAGDDTLVKFLNPTTFRVEDAETIQKSFSELVNLKVDPDDLNFEVWGDEQCDEQFAPSLLKVTIWNGLPGRRVKELVKSLSCPESRVPNYWYLLDVVRGFSQVPIWTPRARSLLTTFSAWVSRQAVIDGALAVSDSQFDPFSEYGYYNYHRDLLDIESAVDKVAQVPPWMRTTKWTGTRLSGWKLQAVKNVNLEWFGVFP